MSEAPKKEDAGKPAAKKAKAPAADVLNQKKDTKVKWTLERCLKTARRFTNEEQWSKGCPAAYKSAVAHGWVAQCTAGMKKSGKTYLKSA